MLYLAFGLQSLYIVEVNEYGVVGNHAHCSKNSKWLAYVTVP